MAPISMRNATQGQSSSTSVLSAVIAAAKATITAPANSGAAFWNNESISAA